VRFISPAAAMKASEETSSAIKPFEEAYIIQRLRSCTLSSPLSPYLSRQQYQLHRGKDVQQYAEMYGPDLFSEVGRYSEWATSVAATENFDIIHSHDWMTILAALNARRITGKPFILHIHALEWDRAGDDGDPLIYDLEHYGMVQADHIISVSHYTKRIICEHYGIDPGKITVIHNAVADTRMGRSEEMVPCSGDRNVLFLGRITYQKGPEYFVKAAAIVREALPDVRFIMVGDGDLMPRIRELVSELGLEDHFLFTGFLDYAEVEQMFNMSDLYVMPSVSEPFGIAPLEAILCNVPVIISRQSGVTEVLHHALTVDFWDVEDLAYKIIAVLTLPDLARQIVTHSQEEIRNLQWKQAALKIVDVYEYLALNQWLPLKHA
jgi:glycosyltransferase involved in cell wall biosynthesis